jgi:CheY-like chemotaxis protein/HPt (histidine-containing phosphotransfer) domain-containing protein
VFTLLVPLGHAASGIAQGVLPPPSRQLRVLLVDDDPVNCEVGEAILVRLGHRATIARDGAEAVARAESQPFDVILMDLHMPDMDGVEAAARIRRLPLASVPRIIVVTADVSRSTRERLAAAGITKVVSKPILMNALREAIEDTPEHDAADAPLATGALIDRHFLDDQKDLLGSSQIAKLRELLDQTGEQLISDITAAAAAGDHKQLARSAHQLGSAASALGLVGLFDRCRDIEQAAPSMSPSECQDAARELGVLREASMSALDDLLAPAAD